MRPSASPVVLLHPDAPAKPAPGARCNGCGVCCAWQPCPLGMLVSRRRQGACSALVWHHESAIYRCGMLSEPDQHLPQALRWLARPMARLARRWIAAGRGCDSTLEVQATGDSPAATAAPH